jgi:formylglycine-generating enzyme required for sulfatase activity
MVPVPQGEFTMGASKEQQEAVRRFGFSTGWLEHIAASVLSAEPPHRIYLDSFYIDTYEVTNGRYRTFVEETGHPSPTFWTSPHLSHREQPVVGVSWYDGVAFCQWLGKRLPTEAEWEKAARGPLALAYPWGDAWDPIRLRSADVLAGRSLDDFAAWSQWLRDTPPSTSVVGPAIVGSYREGASPYGAMDMAGNVWEWVADWFDPSYYAESPESNPAGPEQGERKVLRGGGWDVPRVAAYTWFREYFMGPDEKRAVTGFRCAVSR